LLSSRSIPPGTPPPDSDGGKVIAVFIAVMAQGVLGITIALGSVPLLGFDLSFDDSPIKDVASWVFNSEQKEKLFKSAEPAPIQSAPYVASAPPQMAMASVPLQPHLQNIGYPSHYGRTESG
jgi:hypothetical protein